eukprot:TRINITY_DN19972_c0_g1_i1.p1 TRINITY_DN19972_c0_g1~~TRINITY_DN19972_c0_g1_i1.p1  ORF type:complete len:135 (-),score=39.86 TRINITY_DN19972_c0_g1_i1:45-413(-)
MDRDMQAVLRDLERQHRELLAKRSKVSQQVSEAADMLAKLQEEIAVRKEAVEELEGQKARHTKENELALSSALQATNIATKHLMRQQDIFAQLRQEKASILKERSDFIHHMLELNSKLAEMV